MPQLGAPTSLPQLRLLGCINYIILLRRRARAGAPSARRRRRPCPLHATVAARTLCPRPLHLSVHCRLSVRRRPLNLHWHVTAALCTRGPALSARHPRRVQCACHPRRVHAPSARCARPLHAIPAVCTPPPPSVRRTRALHAGAYLRVRAFTLPVWDTPVMAGAAREWQNVLT
ncbi:hypothetical protein GGX14DRAFT_565277 [Mycena pura]|uniref:Uncharacterized protein n=1 Tax=Mycena pura TaxID=153505 RepID=A0AAD6VJ38_9AGAR|nr:hypothetical protein GGX14DRAFT_565277 [Mycena pura]